MSKTADSPAPPIWLAGSLRQRWNELAPTFYRMGTLSELEALLQERGTEGDG